jgi:hypothetical protein
MDRRLTDEIRAASRVAGTSFSAADVISRGHRRQRRRVASAALVAVVAIAVGAVALAGDDASESTNVVAEPGSPHDASAASDASELVIEDGPPGPLTPREYAATAWIDDALFVWGGLDDGPLADGAILRDGAWETTPAAPLVGGWAKATWTGTEVIVVAQFGEAAAYRPDTRRWRRLASLPGTTFDGLLLAGHGGSAAAIDGRSGRTWVLHDDDWSAVETLPFDENPSNVVSVPAGIVVVGWDDPGPVLASTLDLDTGKWSTPAKAPVRADTYAVGRAGDDILVIPADNPQDAARLRPDDGTWERVLGPPLGGCDGPPLLVAIGNFRQVFAVGGCEGAALLVGETWRPLSFQLERLPPGTNIIGARSGTAVSWFSTCCDDQQTVITRFLHLR